MDYEKKYKEALEKIRSLHRDYNQISTLIDVKEELENIFPELAESEDEKIRKALISAVKANIFRYESIDKKDMLSWLEKQGEQKPQIKLVFPKFRVGDIIQHIPLEKWDTTKKITHIDETGYHFDLSHQGDTVSGGFIGFSFEKDYELVEQKPSDLPKGEDYGIDGLYNAIRILEKTLGKVDGYQTDDGILEHECAISAVKSLYEQKPAWSEEDEKKLDTISRILITDNAERILKIDGYTMVDIAKWLKSLKDRCTKKPIEDHYELEEFAKIVRGNLTGISKAVQKLFEAKYLQLTGNKMYGGFKD